MRNTIAIARKEIGTYFTTPVAYVIFTIFALISGYFFLQILTFFQRQSMQYMQFRATHMLERMNLNDMVMRPLFLNIDVFFLLMIPILTMRLLAEEKRSGTFELLMTTPITPTQIVIGKYLSALTLVATMLAITLVYPILLHTYSDSGIEWGTVLTGYLGMFLMGACFAAIGLFTSSLTSSQVVAAVIGFGVLLIFWVIGWAAAGAEGVWRGVLEYLSVLEHVSGFTRGLIVGKDVIYYLSLVALGLFLSQRMVEAQRWRQ